MKIIFDSQEQKDKFLEMIVLCSDECPGYFGLNNTTRKQCRKNDGCSRCWDECGIEYEVKGENNT